MDDYSLIYSGLALLLNREQSELENYSAIIESSAQGVVSMLRDAQDVTRPEVTELITAKAYVKILLSSQADSVTSFKAGDIAYTKSGSVIDNAKELYKMALGACSKYLTDSGFAFRVV